MFESWLVFRRLRPHRWVHGCKPSHSRRPCVRSRLPGNQHHNTPSTAFTARLGRGDSCLFAVPSPLLCPGLGLRLGLCCFVFAVAVINCCCTTSLCSWSRSPKLKSLTLSVRNPTRPRSGDGETVRTVRRNGGLALNLSPQI